MSREHSITSVTDGKLNWIDIGGRWECYEIAICCMISICENGFWFLKFGMLIIESWFAITIFGFKEVFHKIWIGKYFI